MHKLLGHFHKPNWEKFPCYVAPTKYQKKVFSCMVFLMEKQILRCQWTVYTVLHCYTQTSQRKPPLTTSAQLHVLLPGCTSAKGVVERLTINTLYLSSWKD